MRTFWYNVDMKKRTQRRHLNVKSARLEDLVLTAERYGMPTTATALAEASFELAAATLRDAMNLADAAQDAGTSKPSLVLIVEALQLSAGIYRARAAGALPAIYDDAEIERTMYRKTEAAIRARLDPICEAVGRATGCEVNYRHDPKTRTFRVSVQVDDQPEVTVAFLPDDGTTAGIDKSMKPLVH